MRLLSLATAVAAATLLLSAYHASAFTIVSSGSSGYGASLADPDDQMMRALQMGGGAGGNPVLGSTPGQRTVSAPALIMSQGVLAPNLFYSRSHR
jgi:hypothetical protein